MLLKSVDIQGFKTFPDKTTLKFEDKMLAVVGPNGSGKSNVSDAIRWVLGEQSAKVLRCSKMEDIIFRGATGRKALGYAEVTMNIDNSDRTLDFDNDNLAITRRYYRSGESEYLINKATVRLKDVNELFMDTGIGRDGYSIIGQGKIDSIVSAKSEERREIFEEASGISRFRYRKEESERRLQRCEENLVRLRDIVSELEERVEPLKIQSEKALQFIEYDKEKTSLEIGIWTKTLDNSSKILREHSEKMEIATANYKTIEDELDAISRKNDEAYFKNSSINMQIENERNLVTSFDEEVMRLRGKIGVLENDIKHNQENISRICAEISNTQNSNENIKIEIQNKEKSIKSKQNKIENLNKNQINFADKLNALRKGSDGIISEIDALALQISEITAEISAQRVNFSSVSSLVKEIESRHENIDNSILENNFNYNNLINEKNELEKTVKAMENSILSLENTLSGYNLVLKNKLEKNNLLKEEIDKLNLDVNEKQRKAKILEDLEKNLEGFAHSVKAIIKESKRGFLSGVHGTVSSLIKTDHKYAVAIETALGGAVQNIVVSNEQDAKNAINFLKKREGGRATFLPLTSIKGNEIDCSQFSDIFGFVGLASSLVTCENEYQQIKKSLLGRVIVAENLDSAVVIAKKTSYKFRVVSLDGQVINSGGSLTGGSQTRNVGLLNRAVEIENIRKEAEKIYLISKEKQIIYQKNQSENSQINAKIENIKIEVNEVVQDKIRVITEIKSVEKEILNCEQITKNLSIEKENSSQRIEKLKKEMLEVQVNINDLEINLSNLKQKSEKLLGTRLEKQGDLEEISEKISHIKIQILSVQKDKENLLSEVDFLKKRQSDSESLFEKLNLQKENCQIETRNIYNSINSHKHKIQELTNNAILKRENIKKLVNQREILEKENLKLREMEKDFLINKENVGKELARLQERVQSLQKEYDVIIKKLWDEYELTAKEAREQAQDVEDLKTANIKLVQIRNKIKSLGSVNLSSIEEYKEVKERYEFLSLQVDDVEKSKNELLRLITELTKNMTMQFSERFAEIANNFSYIFRELFGGGTASLSFSDENDILNSGIEIKVHPPGKIVSHIESLSGGEKALVAIAIYFSIMKVNPPPFCMLDEVEAALDDVNVRRFAQYLRKMNENTQFIIITHRRGTMENADMLYGVTMQDDGISKLLELKIHEVGDKFDLK